MNLEIADFENLANAIVFHKSGNKLLQIATFLNEKTEMLESYFRISVEHSPNCHHITSCKGKTYKEVMEIFNNL